MTDAAGEIRRYLRGRTQTALHVRKAGPRGDWVDVRGTGPAGTFRPEEVTVVEEFCRALGLRVSLARGYATIPPSRIEQALTLVRTRTAHSADAHSESPACASAG